MTRRSLQVYRDGELRPNMFVLLENSKYRLTNVDEDRNLMLALWENHARIFVRFKGCYSPTGHSVACGYQSRTSMTAEYRVILTRLTNWWPTDDSSDSSDTRMSRDQFWFAASTSTESFSLAWRSWKKEKKPFSANGAASRTAASPCRSEVRSGRDGNFSRTSTLCTFQAPDSTF